MVDKDKKIDKELDEFLGVDENTEEIEDSIIVKSDKSIVEKAHKTIITEDGRQLLL